MPCRTRPDKHHAPNYGKIVRKELTHTTSWSILQLPSIPFESYKISSIKESALTPRKMPTQRRITLANFYSILLFIELVIGTQNLPLMYKDKILHVAHHSCLLYGAKVWTTSRRTSHTIEWWAVWNIRRYYHTSASWEEIEAILDLKIFDQYPPVEAEEGKIFTPLKRLSVIEVDYLTIINVHCGRLLIVLVVLVVYKDLFIFVLIPSIALLERRWRHLLILRGH